MFFLALVSFMACGLCAAADDRFDQQLAALRSSISPPIKVPFSPLQSNRRALGLPPQLEVMLPAVKSLVVKEVATHAQSLKSLERKKAPKEVAAPKKPAQEDDIFDFELE